MLCRSLQPPRLLQLPVQSRKDKRTAVSSKGWALAEVAKGRLICFLPSLRSKLAIGSGKHECVSFRNLDENFPKLPARETGAGLRLFFPPAARPQQFNAYHRPLIMGIMKNVLNKTCHFASPAEAHCVIVRDFPTSHFIPLPPALDSHGFSKQAVSENSPFQLNVYQHATKGNCA